MTEPKPFAFVLMPINPKFEDIYKSGIKTTAKELGIIAERVDEQKFSESILERIYRQIESADFIIADMTGSNANVFYEVGYAHAKGKTCTLLAQEAKDIPFDLKHHRHLIYGSSIETLKTLLAGEFTWMLEILEQKKKESISVKLKKITGNLSRTEWRHYGEVDISIDIHNRTEKRTPEIEAIYLYTGKGWNFTQGTENCPKTVSEIKPYLERHFIKSPVSRLSHNAWAQLNFRGNKLLWWRGSGEEEKEEYRLVGASLLEIVTSEGNFRTELNMDVIIDEIPF